MHMTMTMRAGCIVTLALRSTGDATHIALDETGERVIDIRAKLGITEGTHVFTGIYCFDPELLDLIPPGEKIAVIPAFLQLARQGRLGAIVLDDNEPGLRAVLEVPLPAEAVSP